MINKDIPKKTNTSSKRRIYIDLETYVDTTVCPTFIANIYVGLQKGYNGNESIVPLEKYIIANSIVQEYCDKVGLCATFEKTHFIYTKGSESGLKVGLINYPRFPRTGEEIVKGALMIASLLKNEFEQHRVSVVTSNDTYMIGDND